MSIREQIKELEIQREENKAELFELYAEQADQKLRWTLHKQPTPFEDRLKLEADIRDHVAERQHSKVKLMKLKQQLRLNSEKSYYEILKQVLTEALGNSAKIVLDKVDEEYKKQVQGEK